MKGGIGNIEMRFGFELYSLLIGTLWQIERDGKKYPPKAG